MIAALLEGPVEGFLKPENKDPLVAVLSYHVVGRELSSNMLLGCTIHVKVIKGEGDRMLAVTKSGSEATVDGATVVAADIGAENGFIHVIDKVMLLSNQQLNPDGGRWNEINVHHPRTVFRPSS